ncbi:MAG: HAD hydrolase-like protein [Eubacteriales bacterium]
MKDKKYIIFDFDGTIYDSGQGVMKGARYALESFGIKVEDLNELRGFNGPPLWDSFMEFYGFTWEQADMAVKKYREYYEVKGIDDGEIYRGIPGLLRELKRHNKTLILATSKAQHYFPRILENLNIQDCFDIVVGSSSDGSRSSKEDVLAYALKQADITNKHEAVMIGDRKFDVIGAKTFGIDSIGVLYGYGSREEFEAAGADYIVDDVGSLCKLLIG